MTMLETHVRATTLHDDTTAKPSKICINNIYIREFLVEKHNEKKVAFSCVIVDVTYFINRDIRVRKT